MRERERETERERERALDYKDYITMAEGQKFGQGLNRIRSCIWPIELSQFEYMWTGMNANRPNIRTNIPTNIHYRQMYIADKNA